MTEISLRRQSIHNFWNIPQTASATTAQATSFKPWIAAKANSPVNQAREEANKTSKIAEGKVKPINAAIAPSQPELNR